MQVAVSLGTPVCSSRCSTRYELNVLGSKVTSRCNISKHYRHITQSSVGYAYGSCIHVKLHFAAHLCICQYQEIDDCKLRQAQRSRLVRSCKAMDDLPHHACHASDVSDASCHI